MSAVADRQTMRRLLQILYAPASWMPAHALAHGAWPQGARAHDARAQRIAAAWINHSIVATLAPDASPEGDLARALERHGPVCAWLSHWGALRRAAYLIGCRSLRGELVTTRQFLKIDQRARAFALLPIVAPRPLPTLARAEPIDATVLAAQGYLTLSGAMQADLDDSPRDDGSRRAVLGALHARLHLMFADTDALLDHTGPRSKPARFPTLIETALHHAETSANDCPSAHD